MKKLWVLLAALLVIPLFPNFVHAQASPEKPADKPIVRVDTALDELVSSDAKVELVKGGFGFTEGTTWIQNGKVGFLIFSDMLTDVLYKLTPAGELSVYLDHSGYTKPDIWKVGMPPPEADIPAFFMIGSNGTTLDPQGRLVIATWTGRSIDRIEKDGKRTTLADRYNGKRFGGTNDVVVKKDGAVYFTDSYGGMRARDKDPSKELDSLGIYMVKDGKVSLAISDIKTPNGLAFSPDEKYLYANAGLTKIVRRYDVQPDDTLTNSRLFFDMNVEDKSFGVADGMRVDVKGNLYESGPGGIWIISPEGKHLGTILIPEPVANLTFGGADHKTVYVGTRSSIYRVQVKTPGIH